MELNKRELWTKLNDYHFNHLVPPTIWHQITEKFGGTNASTEAFADKIARKHNWKHNFALTAIYEYKKFVYLGVIGNFVVTPSKIIDIVWHEHLLFTKAYREFCDEIIQYQFEHNPELIVLDEQTEKFASQYVKTLHLYRYEFGYDAPLAVWDLPKFSKEQLLSISKLYPQKKAKKKEYGYAYDGGAISSSDAPLSSYFDAGNFNDFGGGDFGGGGAGADFSDSGDSSCSSCSSGCSSCGGGGD
jgi:hypothetical protein